MQKKQTSFAIWKFKFFFQWKFFVKLVILVMCAFEKNFLGKKKITNAKTGTYFQIGVITNQLLGKCLLVWDCIKLTINNIYKNR